MIVDLITKDKKIVLDSQVTDGADLLLGEDLAHGVMRGIEEDDLGPWGDGRLKLLHIHLPGGGGDDPILPRLPGDQGQEDGDTTVHGDIGEILVKVGFKEDDLVPLVEVGGKDTEDAFVSTRGDKNVRGRIYGPAKGWRVVLRQGLKKSRASSRRRILVKGIRVNGVARSIFDQLGWGEAIGRGEERRGRGVR